MRSKFNAIKAILFCSNFIVITDHYNTGDVSPLYADHFLDKILVAERELHFAARQHKANIDRLGNNLVKDIDKSAKV